MGLTTLIHYIKIIIYINRAHCSILNNRISGQIKINLLNMYVAGGVYGVRECRNYGGKETEWTHTDQYII